MKFGRHINTVIAKIVKKTEKKTRANYLFCAWKLSTKYYNDWDKAIFIWIIRRVFVFLTKNSFIIDRRVVY